MPRLLLVLFVAVLSPAIAAGQDSKPSPLQFRILATGGFLGQMDGFCEQPGGTYDLKFGDNPLAQKCPDKTAASKDAPVPKLSAGKDAWPIAMGGLLGARTWLRTQAKVESDFALRSNSDLIVLTGNNQVANFTFLDEKVLLGYAIPTNFDPLADADTPRDAQIQLRFWRYWQEMANLKADAIGLSSEDFLRSLRDPREEPKQQVVKNRASILQRWLTRIKSTTPIIASNAVVKFRHTTDGGMNEVQAGGFELAGVDDDDSVGWLTAVEVGHPLGASATLTLVEIGPIGKPAGVERTVGATTTCAEASTKIEVTDGALKPGYEYRVDIKTSAGTETLTFKTHLALTPRDNPSPRLKDFPLVEKAITDDSPVLIVNLVDPDIKPLVGSDAWKWQSDGCPDDECEIDFLSASDTLKVIIARAFTKTAPRQPFIVLISALSDAQTLELLEEYPEIRAVILPPDSLMLGRASREYSTTDDEKETVDARLARRLRGQGFSGDLGMVGIFNAQHAQASLLAARPEWVGETGAVLSATRHYDAKHSEWHVTGGQATTATIPGAALHWSACAAKTNCTEFWMNWEKKAVPYGSFDSYHVCSASQTQEEKEECEIFASLGTLGALQMFAGDAFRRGTGSELAIVPGDLFDPDAMAWLAAILKPADTRVLTRLVLERALYRSFRIVRARVSGDALVSKIDAALKSGSYPDSCVVGTSGSCATAIDTKHPDRVFLNGRIIDQRLYYSIAMPEGLAEELGLEHSEGTKHTGDAVSIIHERLSPPMNASWLSPGTTPLGARIEKAAKRKPQMHAIASSVEFGYTELSLTEPLDRVGTIKGTNIDFRSVTPSQTVAAKVDFDFAVLDLERWALRGITNVDFARKKTTANDEVSLDSNDWTGGVRLDYKIPAFKREIRLYGGYFWEGELKAPDTYLKASIELGGETITSAGTTIFEKDPLQFRYGAVGIDFLNIWKPFSETRIPIDITKGSFQYATGKINNVPIGATIDGIEQDRSLFTGPNGIEAVLNAFFLANDQSLTRQVTYVAVDEDRAQQRYQLDFDFAPRFKLWSKEWKWLNELRSRHYPIEVANAVKYSFRWKTSLTMPIVRRLEVVPSYEYQFANVHTLPGSYSQTTIQVNFKVPFVLKAGWGWMFE
jgi:hypothetical protein